MIFILRLNGRIWWCKCGRWNLWTWKVIDACNSQHFVDLYSFTHINHGIVLYWLTGDIFTTVVYESLWEILENTPGIIDSYRKKTISIGYTGDSIANSIGDLLCCCLGFYMQSISVFIILELFLGWLIRDNLILNIIMIIYPVQFIKRWQQGKLK